MDATGLVTNLLSNVKEAETGKVYTLQSGESLQSIAARIGVSETQLLQANPHVQIASLVGPGDTLALPVASDDLGPNGHEDNLIFGAARTETDRPPTDLPPVVVPPPPLPPPPPPPPPPPDYDPGPEPPGGGGGGGSPSPVTEADTVEDIAEVLGEEVSEIISKSPSLKEALEELLENEDENERWTVKTGSFSETQLDSKTIVISSEATPEEAVAFMAHEAGHALHGDQFDWSSLSAFLDSGMTTEAEGAFFNLQVREELASEDIDIPMLSSDLETTSTLYEEAWSDYRQNGNREQVINTLAGIFRQHESTAEGQSYVQFYTDYYNAEQSPPPPGGGDGGGGEPPGPPTQPQ